MNYRGDKRMEKNEDVAVSIICTAYNCEKFIEQCLEGIVSQKTTFLFEAIVHDDASSDGTREIVERYATRYPDIIKPIIQTENQYSKGVSIVQDIIFPKCKGRYIAFCEGDDYWCCANKLQKQFDYMEEHEECSMCVHNTVRHDLKNGQETLFFENSVVHIMNEDEVFMEWKVHTSSYFMRSQIMVESEFSKRYWFGDYVFLTIAYYAGNVVMLPDVMSVYNYNNPMGVTFINSNMQDEQKREKALQRADYLREYNVYTNTRFNEIVCKRICEIEFSDLVYVASRKFDRCCDYRECKETAQLVIRSEYYSVWMKNKSYKQRIYSTIKYRGYIFGEIWMIILKLKKWWNSQKTKKVTQ